MKNKLIISAFIISLNACSSSTRSTDNSDDKTGVTQTVDTPSGSYNAGKNDSAVSSNGVNDHPANQAGSGTENNVGANSAGSTANPELNGAGGTSTNAGLTNTKASESNSSVNSGVKAARALPTTPSGVGVINNHNDGVSGQTRAVTRSSKTGTTRDTMPPEPSRK